MCYFDNKADISLFTESMLSSNCACVQASFAKRIAHNMLYDVCSGHGSNTIIIICINYPYNDIIHNKVYGYTLTFSAMFTKGHNFRVLL